MKIEVLKYQNLMKICPVKAELFHADGQRDRHVEAKMVLLNFCERA